MPRIQHCRGNVPEGGADLRSRFGVSRGDRLPGGLEYKAAGADRFVPHNTGRALDRVGVATDGVQVEGVSLTPGNGSGGVGETARPLFELLEEHLMQLGIRAPGQLLTSTSIPSHRHCGA